MYIRYLNHYLLIIIYLRIVEYIYYHKNIMDSTNTDTHVAELWSYERDQQVRKINLHRKPGQFRDKP